MGHVIETATSGRAGCRGCGQRIAKGDLRFGERLPNPYGEGEMTLWFHPLCAAYKRPEPLLEVLEQAGPELDDAADLRAAAECGQRHRRLPRLDVPGRAPTSRARCRSCREMIEKAGWRIGLVYYQDGRFEPSGFIHAGCATDYFEFDDVTRIVERLEQFAPDPIDAADRDELRTAVASS